MTSPPIENSLAHYCVLLISRFLNMSIGLFFAGVVMMIRKFGNTVSPASVADLNRLKKIRVIDEHDLQNHCNCVTFDKEIDEEI